MSQKYNVKKELFQLSVGKYTTDNSLGIKRNIFTDTHSVFSIR